VLSYSWLSLKPCSRPQICCVVPGYGFGVVDSKIAVLFDTVRHAIPVYNVHCEQPHDTGVAEKTGTSQCATEFSS